MNRLLLGFLRVHQQIHHKNKYIHEYSSIELIHEMFIKFL